MEGQNANISIKVPERVELEEVWSMMERIHEKQKKYLVYEDVHTEHTKETLRKVIEHEEKMERIWIACMEEKVIGLIDVIFRGPDYMFFDDKYVEIRYFYVEEQMQQSSNLLMETAIHEARQYGFEYMCGDVLSDDEVQRTLYGNNQFEDYRIRLARKLH